MPSTTRRAILCAATLFTLPAVAQVDAALEGRLADPTGAAIPAARITLTQTATGVQFHTISSAAGLYNFRSLVPGIYSVIVEAPGFQRLLRTGITATVGQTISLNLAIPLAATQDTITVDADAPLLQSAQADIETHIPGQTVRDLPLNSRNFINLTQLAPGVSLPPGTLLPRINGGRPRTNEYLFDGISALQPEPGQVAFFPIVDDIAEFTVEADNVPAEFGRFNGGVVNVATRAGGNRFHGSLYEFFRNQDLNARNYFAVPAARKPEYRRNLFGGTLGGPVLHDHLFYFADYQAIKSLIGRPIISTIPTLNERQGIFTGVAKIYNPASTVTTGGKQIRTEFPNDTINTPLDPAAVALLARFPTPTTSAAANNYTRTANDADHQNQFDFRLDGAYHSRDRAFGRYSYFSDVEQPITALPDGSGTTAGAVLGTGNVAGLSHVLGQQAVFNETHQFSPRLVNDYRLGYTRRGNTIAGPTVGSGALGIPGIPTNGAFSNALPLFTFTGFQQLGPAAGTFSQYQTGVWETTDALSYTIGRHAFKAGLDFRFYQLNAIAPPNPTGSFAFTTTGTDTQTAASTATTGGNSLASFLLGQVDTFSIDLQTTKIRPRDHIQEYFLEDDWRATGKLTLNLGARYTIAFASTEKNNQGAVFNLQTQLLDYVGQSGNPTTARPTRYDNVAPRLGLTYLLTPRTVVRSGFGIVFIDQSGITTPFTVPQFPYIQNVQQKTQDSINAAFKLSNGPTVNPIPLTRNAGLGQSVYTVDRQANAGYVEQWNLAFQQTITKNLSFDIAYVGSHIVHVGIPDSNLNQLTAAQLAAGTANGVSLTTKVTNPYYNQLPTGSTLNTPTIAEAQLIKPYPRFQNVATYRNNSGTANYNAIEAKVEQRMTRGVYLLVAYTHSKLIDDASSVFSSTVLSSPNTSSLVAADTFRPYLERDSSSGDTPNVISAAITYQIPNIRAPFMRGLIAHEWVHRSLGGWSLNTIVTAQSGMPVTVTQATNNNAFAGFALQRPNLLHNPQLHGDARAPQHFFDTTAFATAGTYQIGNASRNPVRGPAYRDLDLSAVKNTRFTERTDLEFRAELFNLTNTPAFSQPNGSFGSAAFGTITSTTTEQRVVQLAAKLHF